MALDSRPARAAAIGGATRARAAGADAATGALRTAPVAPRALDLTAGPRGVLLFHGLSSSPLELLYVARGLHQAGYTVRVPVIEGYTHGLAGAGVRERRRWRDAALAEFDRMRTRVDDLAVGGLCIGAVLALHVATARPRAVAALLCLSTTLHYDGWGQDRWRWLLPLLPLVPFVPFAGRIAVPEHPSFGVKDERLRAWISTQMRETGTSDAGAAKLRAHDLYQAKRLADETRRKLATIEAPTLVVHARADEAASPRSARDVADGVNSANVRCVLLDDSFHMITIDREKTHVLDELRRFLASSGGGAPEAPRRDSRSTPRSAAHVDAR